MSAKQFIESDIRGANIEQITTLEVAELSRDRVDADFDTRLQLNQPKGICILNTTLPNEDTLS